MQSRCRSFAAVVMEILSGFASNTSLTADSSSEIPILSIADIYTKCIKFSFRICSSIAVSLSDLLITAIHFLFLIFLINSISSALRGQLPSKTAMISSAASTVFHAISTPIPSITSSVSRIPAVSESLSLISPRLIDSSTTSRVVCCIR